MAIVINNIDIHKFRGINNLSLTNLNHINIIAGDNNSGKTSILESIMLLKNPIEMYNAINVSRLREANTYYTSPTFESFLNMLSRKELGIGLSATTSKGDVAIEISGELENIIVDTEMLMANRYRQLEINETETTAYKCRYSYVINGDYNDHEYLFTNYTDFNKLPRSRGLLFNISYLAPSRHLLGNNISNIVKSTSYKQLCVYLLKLFDMDIEDILYTRNEITHRPIECIQHKTLGVMPISTYGDGIKKVISLANGIASSKDGVLMIDEIETSVHKKYYEDIFTFLFKACKQYNVQLFITTHSREAIDAILAIEKYSENAIKNDQINVITFRKDIATGKTLSRTLSGTEVLKYQENFDFEVRI